ncbi:MAG: hypothetical protein ACPGU1_11440 [Myxococcota bacterium]
MQTETYTSTDASTLLDVEQRTPGATPLVHAARWEALSVDDDPIADPSLSASDQCPDEALTVEVTEDGLYLDLDTTTCSWLTVAQTTIAPIQVGGTMRVWAFRWPNLIAEGQGLLQLSAGDPPETLWEHRPELPNDRSELYYEEFPVTRGIPTGTPIYWHVANHGQNVWSLVNVLRVD